MRARRPLQLICAVPVASRDAMDKMRAYADEIVCLEIPDFFYAVGQFYRHFPQVSDSEVVALLQTPAESTAGCAGTPSRERDG